MGSGVMRLDEGLMPLLSFGVGAGEGELTVVEPPLDIEVGFDEILIALPCCIPGPEAD
jgi:hypothetical protein